MTATFDLSVKLEYDGTYHYVLINGLRSKVRAKDKSVATVYARVVKLALPTIAKAMSVAMKGEE